MEEAVKEVFRSSIIKMSLCENITLQVTVMEVKTITLLCKYYEQNVPNYQKYSLKVFHFYISILRINTTTALMCMLHVSAVDVYG